MSIMNSKQRKSRDRGRQSMINDIDFNTKLEIWKFK